MKKRIIAFLLIVGMGLTGCTGDFPELSDEDTAAIGQYAAVTLLKYDANSRSRLVDFEKIEEDKTNEAEKKEPENNSNQNTAQDSPADSHRDPGQGDALQNGENQSGTQNPSQNPSRDSLPGMDTNTARSLEEYLEIPEGVTIELYDIDVCDHMSEEGDSYFSLDASAGKKLLVLNMSMKNTSSGSVSINLLDRKDIYQVTVNNQYTDFALTTMHSLDMSCYKGNLKAGETKELLILVEVDAKIAESIQSISLNLKNESKTYTIRLK